MHGTPEPRLVLSVENHKTSSWPPTSLKLPRNQANGSNMASLAGRDEASEQSPPSSGKVSAKEGPVGAAECNVPVAPNRGTAKGAYRSSAMALWPTAQGSESVDGKRE